MNAIDPDSRALPADPPTRPEARGEPSPEGGTGASIPRTRERASAMLRSVWIRWRATLAVTLLLFALPLVLLAPQTLGGRSPIPYDALVSDPVYRADLRAAGVEQPQNELVADLVYQNLVWKELLVDSLSDGEWPLWNPYILGGVPFLAGGQHGLFAPQTLLFAWLDTDRAFGWGAVLLLWWAGLGAFALSRALRLATPAAIVAAVAWSLSTLFSTNVVFPMIQGAMAWTPWLLAGISAVTDLRPGAPPRGWLPRGRDAARLVGTALAAALVALAGHAEMLIYAALVASTWAAWRLYGIGHAQGRRAAVHVGVWLGLAALAGALVSAVQWLPLLELARTSSRAGAVYDDAVQHAFGLRQLATFFVPDFYGNPAHHAVPLLEGRRSAGLATHAMWGTAWGTRNYVEAAAYVGLLPWLLAVVALFDHKRRTTARFFALVAGLSLAFAFGTPLYRLVFAIPGIDQLRSPFRWVFPFVLAMAILSALGLDALLQPDARRATRAQWAARAVGLGAVVGGIGAGFALALAWVVPARWTSLVERAVGVLPDARAPVLDTFGSMAAFAAYQYWNLLHAVVFLTLSGIILSALARPGLLGYQTRRLAAAAVTILALDLWLIGFGFNPAVDPALGQIEPAAVTFLAEASELEWGRVIGYGDAKILWPNTGMRAGIRDLRGYDSIIPSWIAETLDAISEQDGWLRFNRIGNPVTPDALTHPALAAFGGRYVVTRERLDVPGLDLIHDEDVRVYENTAAMPRAWVVTNVRVVADRTSLLEDLRTLEPRETVLLEEDPDLSVWDSLRQGRQVFQPWTRVRSESRNELELDVFAGAPGMLVLSESWFPGWRAWVTPAVAGGPRAVEVPVFRANGAMRAVPVPAGRMTVRFQYFPMSVKIGLYASFLGLILLFLAAVYALWMRFVRIDEDDAVQRVAVNSVGPIGAALLGKVLLFVFAMLYLRVLGPEQAGKYYLAVTVYTLADIITNFGLNLLVAREVARRPADAAALLASSTALRLLLWLVALPVIAGYIALQSATGHPLDGDTRAAIGLLALALVPANLNTALSSIFQGLERMVLPAAVSIVSTLFTVSLGALALLAGWGFVGLAGMAILTNWLTFAILLTLVLRAGIRPWGRVSPRMMRWMAAASFPLMLNHLLQVVFFKIDVLLLEPLKGSLVVGWYQSAYKWVEALLILPAYLTMALFPLMSRKAENDPEGLHQAMFNVIRWLVAIALPVAVVTTFLADPLIRLLGGDEYLPQGAQTLQVMIWFLPFSYVNGVVQYVLIALDRQRWITLSFTIAATFNIVANWLVIPTYGHVGAAAVTIVSEIILMAPFFWGLRDLGAPPLLVLAWRPLLGASAMALILAGAADAGLPGGPAALASVIGYVIVLRVLGWLSDEDRAVLDRLVPGRRPTG